MSWRVFALPVVLLFLATLQVAALKQSTLQRKALPLPGGGEVLPSTILRLGSLEFNGLSADLLQLTAMVAFGETLERGVKPEAVEWRWLYGTLNNATELDPYFLDPYIFGNAVLTWDAHLVREANALLEKGSRYRSWDYQLPFYQGFNSFYFLGDDQTAADLLMEASRRPEAPPLLASLASRLAYKGARTTNAILFLEGILAREEDEGRRKEYRLRLDALRGIAVLEQAVTIFRERLSRAPKSIAELQEAGILRSIPRDPYGGTFFIDETGRVRTTSDLRMAKPK